jgi:hypothetical protein
MAVFGIALTYCAYLRRIFSGTCELSNVIAVSLSVSLLEQSDGHGVDLYELL